MEAAILTAIDARLRIARAPVDGTAHVLRVDGAAVGILDAARAQRLAGFADVFRVGGDAVEFAPQLRDACTRSAAIVDVARALAREGRLSAWRDELFAVSEAFGAPPAFVIERAAARYFGIRTWAAHVNGVVQDADGTSIWFARRSERKPIDPGMLDNLVGGGIAAWRGVRETVVKEAWEEAGIPAALASRASAAGTVDVCRVNADGVQRETIFIHDLWLPPDFIPANQDGEAVEHRRVSLPEAARLLAVASGPDQVTIDASLVALDFLLRNDALPGDSMQLAALQALIRPGPRARSPFRPACRESR
jgi:8-oxo-dGTP pyrophosphatase MutT (NUDIX family)